MYSAKASIPRIFKISVGAGVPSTIISPLLTLSPSLKYIYVPFGIKYSTGSPFSGLIIILLLLLISLPNSITPESSAKTAGFFGFLDSKISATLGSPPVISFVFEEALGILAITSPALTSFPFSIFRTIPTLKS